MTDTDLPGFGSSGYQKAEGNPPQRSGCLLCVMVERWHHPSSFFSLYPHPRSWVLEVTPRRAGAAAKRQRLYLVPCAWSVERHPATRGCFVDAIRADVVRSTEEKARMTGKVWGYLVLLYEHSFCHSKAP